MQCKRPGFNPWVGQIPWRRAQQPILVFLPGESPWTEESGGLLSMGSQRVGYDWATKHTHTHSMCMFIFSDHCQFSIGIVQFGLLPALLYFSYSGSCRITFHYSSNLHFREDEEHFYISQLAIWISPFVKYLFRSFVHSSTGLFILCHIDLYKLYICDRILFRFIYYKYFLLLCRYAVGLYQP